MAPFFLPASADGADAEQTYADLREQAEQCTGTASRNRRIEEIECRRSGRDCLLRVGEPDAANGRMVAAIIQLGRDTYTVHHVPTSSADSVAPTVLQRTDVYSVGEFR
jgi:hypothetical protein